MSTSGTAPRVSGAPDGYHPRTPRRARSSLPVPRAGAVRRVEEGTVLDIQIEQADGYTICRPVGELDAFTVSQFRQALAELASTPRLLIDMAGVPFVDSAGLGALIGGIRRSREMGGGGDPAGNPPPPPRLLRTPGAGRPRTP